LDLPLFSNYCNVVLRILRFANINTIFILWFKDQLFGKGEIFMFFKKMLFCSTLTLLLGLTIQPIFSEDIGIAPIPVQAAVFLKLLEFDKNISSGGSITIYVVGSPDFAAAMKKAEGKAVGAATIGKVIEGPGVPSEKPSVIYIGSESVLSQLQTYTSANKVLSITGNPEFVSKGVSLSVGISEGKPKIMLNLSASKDEGVDWNPAILKVAATIK
jgi:hypothetical protein